METIYSDLKQLGAQSDLPSSPEDAVLERVDNPVSYTHLTLPTIYSV